MIGTTTRRFTQRSQDVKVLTVSSLREHLDAISTPQCKFEVEKVSKDRVSVRAVIPSAGKRVHPVVVLPAYPTGHADDQPGNPNVVLDPLEFVNAETHEERHIFVPLLGHDVLVHYDKMHPYSGLQMTRCC
jgi:hypothetical protein